jgi:hypothetical protein
MFPGCLYFLPDFLRFFDNFFCFFPVLLGLEWGRCPSGVAAVLERRGLGLGTSAESGSNANCSRRC